MGYFSYRSQTAFAIPVNESLSLVLTNPANAADTRTVSIKWLGLYRQKLLGERDDIMTNMQQLDDIRHHAREAGHHGDANEYVLLSPNPFFFFFFFSSVIYIVIWCLLCVRMIVRHWVPK